MSITSKSPNAVARTALRVASRALPPYSHRFSPKRFTQPQLLTIIVLKTFFKTDFRGIIKLLQDMPQLTKILKLKTVPHYTTIQKASARLLVLPQAQHLLNRTAKLALANQTKIKLAAIDSTGLQSGHISPYFLQRCSNGRKPHLNTQMTTWPKMAIIADTRSHVIVSVYPTRGPKSDSAHFKAALSQLPPGMTIEKLLADAGYDSEANHCWARLVCGIKTVIPPKIGSPTKLLPKKPFRREMATHFDAKSYRKRGQVETVFSMLKRNLGYSLRSRSQQSQNSEMYLLAITHNIMVVLFFYLLKSFSTEQNYNYLIALQHDDCTAATITL